MSVEAQRGKRTAPQGPWEPPEGLRRLCRTNFHTACLLEELTNRPRLRGKKPVLVYQMGKVGSCAVARSIVEARAGYKAYHLHFLTPENIRMTRRENRMVFRERRRIFRHLIHSHYVSRRLHERRFTRDLRIITLTREPVSRAVSAFFEFIDINFPRYGFSRKLASTPPERLIPELTDMFWECFDSHCSWPEQWFETELRAVFGFDVFEEPFPRAEGYTIRRRGEAALLILKLEHLNGCVEAAFREFLGVESCPLVRSNDAEDKAYRKLYREFTRSLVVPEEKLELAYGSRYARHFYSDEELIGFRRKWLRAA